MKRLLIFFSIVALSFVNFAKANEIKILYKLENEIITNQDIIDELNYLVSLNNNLISLEKNKLNQIAVRSIIKEKIKYLELKKYFKIDENTKEVDNIVLSAKVFNAKENKDIIARLVNWQLAKRRQGTHKVKERGEIVGSTAKIYKQKGMGRARHGSKKVVQFKDFMVL